MQNLNILALLHSKSDNFYVMDTVLENEAELKKVFKAAILETLEERKDLFSEIFREITEDIALAKAIEEGEKSPEVPRSAVFDVLERKI